MFLKVIAQCSQNKSLQEIQTNTALREDQFLL